MADNFEVKSTGKASKNTKADEELKKLRKAAKADKEKAEKAQKETKKETEAQTAAAKKKAKAAAAKNKKKLTKVEKQMTGVAAGVGGALLSELTDESVSKKKKGMILLLAVLAVAVLAVGVFAFRSQISSLLGLNSTELSDILPDPTMGYNEIDFTNAVLGKAREEAKLVVLEQDVEVDSEISNALAHLDIFKKTKEIHSVGTGYYTVELDGFSEENVSVDVDKKLVTVTIPHAVLDHSAIDPDKTTFEDTDHALLGFGEVKLTQEQQNELDKSIKNAMEEVLDTDEQYAKADEIACLKVRELFQPVVTAVAEEFIVEVVQ